MTISDALISGSLRRALYRDAQGTWLVGPDEPAPRPAAPNDIATFYRMPGDLIDAGAEGESVSLEELRRRLEAEIEFVEGLDGLLVGMDSEFSDDLRSWAIRDAEQILTESIAARKRIRARILIPANPQEWDPAGADRLARACGAAAAAAVYRSLSEGTVDRIAADLNALIIAQYGTGVEAQVRRDRLIGTGLIAELCAAAVDRSTLLAVPFERSAIPQLDELDPGRKILTALVKHLAGPAVRDDLVVSASSEDRSGQYIDPIAQAASRAIEGQGAQKRKVRPTYDLDGIQREIRWICERLRRGEVGRAEVGLIHLIDDQARSSRPADIIKSLTAIADHARQLRDFDFAMRLLNAADLLETRDPAVMCVRGELLRDLGRLDEALAVFRETMERFPHNEVARNAYAETLGDVGRPDEALAVFRETMERFPPNEVTRNAYAETLRELGRADEALAVFRETMASAPHDEVTSTAYAETLRELGRADEALAVFRETMERFSHNEVMRNAYAETLREVGRPDEALAVFRETIERFPQDEVAPTAYAETLLEVGRADAALAMFRETIERFPHDEVAPTAYADALREVGRLDEALAVFRETIERFPHNKVTRNAYAEALRESGRPDEALAVFRETMERFPHDGVAPTAYAGALREVGRADEALAAFRETMERFPHNKVTRNAYAEALRDVGRPDEALAVFRETMKRFPHNRVVRNAYAETLREVGRADEALAMFRETLERFPYDELTRNSCANLLIGKGDVDDGEALLATAVYRLQLRSDWIGLHIVAMGNLRRRSIPVALEMLRYGGNECPFSGVKQYFRNALAVALIMDRRAKEALAELEAAQEQAPAPQKANTLLVRAHALGECGQMQAADREISEVKAQFALSEKQQQLADTILIAYVRPPSMPRAGSSASKEHIYRLEFDLMTKLIVHAARPFQSAV